MLGDHTQARAHATTSIEHTSIGRPGWAAATLVLARAETARGHTSDAADLAHHVLDTISAPALRETSRVRLRDLDIDLFAAGAPGPAARDLHDRIQALPELVPIGHMSEEPNGA